MRVTLALLVLFLVAVVSALVVTIASTPTRVQLLTSALVAPIVFLIGVSF